MVTFKLHTTIRWILSQYKSPIMCWTAWKGTWNGRLQKYNAITRLEVFISILLAAWFTRICYLSVNNSSECLLCKNESRSFWNDKDTTFVPSPVKFWYHVDDATRMIIYAILYMSKAIFLDTPVQMQCYTKIRGA